MYNAAQKREYDNMVFMAAIHGIDLNDNKSDGKKQSRPKGQKILLFDAPENYEKMSKEERENKTKAMMAQMKMLAKQTGM